MTCNQTLKKKKKLFCILQDNQNKASKFNQETLSELYSEGERAKMEEDGFEGEPNRVELGTCLSSYIDNGSTESHRYFLSRRTVLEMLRDRGYTPTTSDADLTLQQFREIYGQSPDVDRLKLSAVHRSDPSKRVRLHAFL